MIRGIIFDYDGTIAQTLEIQERWLRFWSQENKKVWPFQNYNEFRDFYNREADIGNFPQVYRALELPYGDERDHPVWAAYNHFRRENPPQLYPGIRECLHQLFEWGNLSDDPRNNTRVKIGLNTTNTWKSVGHQLRTFGLLGYFDSKITEEVLREAGGGNPTKLYKPSTASTVMLLNLLGTKGSETVHVGDTLSDLLCAHQVTRKEGESPENLVTIGVTYGFEGRKVLERGAETPRGKIYFDHLVDHPEEIFPLLKSL
jgi:phosphoglycolate phosphatase-like HAD superfamily hydrolase